MNYQGILNKMEVDFQNPIIYRLNFLSDIVTLNTLIEKKISLQFTGNIYCVVCGKKIPKSFFQGFCYTCFRSSPEASDCILAPELCRAHEGIGRNIDWEIKHHLQPHAVYLAASSDIKVGVTRETQALIRWIDQGASQAIILAKTPNRYLAGLIEVALKKYISDKTNWRKMLKNELITINLIDIKTDLISKLPPELSAYKWEDNTILNLTYPSIKFPEKVTSVTFDKFPLISGVLIGIKGQYLIFENCIVLNIRKHTGYEVFLTT